MWQNSRDLMASVYEAHAKLATGEIDANTAHAQARLLDRGIKIMVVELEHARLTSRLTIGSSDLPGLGLGTFREALADPIDHGRRRLTDVTAE